MDKPSLRQQIWDTLEAEEVARFPFPPHDRIPNFEGADEAAARLGKTDAWREAETVKSNPDSPQKPVREMALRQDKTVLMAVPRLRDADCFVELDPDRVDAEQASSISGAFEAGRQVAPDAVGRVDLIVAGSVAVNETGARIGKGEGYSDLEYAILAAFDAVDGETTVVTTVHELQVVDETWDVDAHDVPLDLVVTPERTIRTETPYPRPEGIDWSALEEEEKIEEIPILAELRG